MNADEWQRRFVEISGDLAWLAEGKANPDANLSSIERDLLDELDDLEFQAGRAAMQNRRQAA